MTDTASNVRYRSEALSTHRIARLNVQAMDDPQTGLQRIKALQRFKAKAIYFGLLKPRPDATSMALSRRFLTEQLASVAKATTMDSPPSDMQQLLSWMHSNNAAVGKQYRRYLAAREAGGTRRYFPTKSHALHFLRAVAPTKLVDGAWLYGLVKQWQDPRYGELIRTYLEELGEGEPDKNHVVLYRKLLAANDCVQWEQQADSRFVQGAIQLALAHHAHEFVPEIIGFNLGYEQLPLHLLICAYELAELGIDPYYFTLHITVDNASTGHAAKAVQAVFDAMPQLGDRETFYRRVCNGYRLNALGDGTKDIIANFDLEQAMYDLLAAKAEVGADLHSDYCRIGGKTTAQWLREPDQIPGFIKALEDTGWIRRHEPPENSRFWKLLTGDKAAMFGVFNTYELQVIHDWIAGDCALQQQRHRRFRARQSSNGHAADAGHRTDDFSSETRLLKDQLANAKDDTAATQLLVQWLSPALHHTQAGLLATRMFIARQGLCRQADLPCKPSTVGKTSRSHGYDRSD